MFLARITKARFQNKFIYLQANAMAAISRPTAKIYLGGDEQFPSIECTVTEDQNPLYGRARCPALFSSPPLQGATKGFPLQLGDEVQYEVREGGIFIHSIFKSAASSAPIQSPVTEQVSNPTSVDTPLKPSCDQLLSIGFEDAAKWTIDENGKIAHKGDDPRSWDNLIKVFPQALYAFCIDNEVKYVGKTVSTIQTRFSGYRSPGSTNLTNQRCNEEIKDANRIGKVVRILVLPNRVPLQWGKYTINIAAGLEDALIDELQPDWNA